MRRWAIALALVIASVALFRPLSAAWCDDMGNLAFARGDGAAAGDWFARGLQFEPRWSVLLEDRGRTELQSDPVGALALFEAADCGSPCVASEGDAQIRLGHPQAAVDDFLSAHAVERVAQTAQSLADSGRYDEAIALEGALVARLGAGMLAQADVATAYDAIGKLDAEAAIAMPRRARSYERDAIVSYRRASALAPYNEGYLLSLGFAELDWGRRQAAKNVFERVLDLHPHQADAERGIAAAGKPGS
jgi:tetratricopeptide (TPR) repeat protein